MYGIHLPWQGTGMSVVAIFLVVSGKLCCKLSNICKSKTVATSFWLSSGGEGRGEELKQEQAHTIIIRHNFKTSLIFPSMLKLEKKNHKTFINSSLIHI